MITVKTNIWRTDYTADIPLEMYEDVKNKHPNFDVSVYFNPNGRVKLSKLADNESVCFGDGKSFVFILTKK